MDYSECLEELENDLAFYKRVLGIEDWSISVTVMSSRYVECNGKRVIGTNSYLRCHRAAIVTLAMHDADFIRNLGDVPTILPCMEKTLVHELLHCVCGDDSDEQLVERVARTILLVRYGLDPSFFDASEIKLQYDA
jgi:hypothetical protein